MKLTEDYRSNVQISLRIMKAQREKLYEDIIRHYSGLYNGLHEPDSGKVRALYYEAYLLEWLDQHWDQMAYFLRGKSKKEQRELTVFFASYFSELMQKAQDDEANASASLSELLKAQLASVNQLIECSDAWDERSNQLQVNLKKHKYHYKKLIEQAKSKKEEE
ncbi:MAG: hypothetical protein IJ060_08675 [Oscillospiraceae bacterium]|nr:hypothetical protein [Oscillospiraceae bacterium]